MEPRNLAKLIGAGVGGLLVASLLLGSCYAVDQGEQAVITRFGAVSDVTGPGLHGKLPFVDRATKISTRTESIEWIRLKDSNTVMEAYSHDQQPAEISVKLVYRVKADAASVRELYTVFRNTDSYASRVLIPRTAQAIKTTFGQFTAVSVVQNRARFNAEAEAAVLALLGDGPERAAPVTIEGVQIQNIDFSDAYEHAVEARMQAQVEVEKVTQNLERERKSAEIRVVQAEADAKSVRLRGEAEAAAIKARSDALRDSPRLVELTAAEKWDGKLPATMVPNGAVPFLGRFDATGSKP